MTLSSRPNARLLALGAALAGLACIGAAPDAHVPNFAVSLNQSWVPEGDDYTPPASGPGPVTFDPAHPYVPNFTPGKPPTYRVADLSNPILKPWAVERMKKDNDAVIAGKIPFRARERCWPPGVPAFAIYSLVEPLYFIQTPAKVTIIDRGNQEVRRVYMNAKHSAKPAPSWYGESIGHYENGDTLVVDTIGLTEKSFVDNYRTPHTGQLHVVERYRLIDNGKRIELTMTIDDPGAFNTAWTAMQSFRLNPNDPFDERICAENANNFFGQDLLPIPQAAKADF